jgi:hypothetical protein
MSYNERNESPEIMFAIESPTVLREREDGVEKCNSTLRNEDQKWRDIVVQDVGCLPAYWTTFQPISSLSQNSSNCTQGQYHGFEINLTEQLETVNETAIFFRNMSKLYINPCTKMETSVRVNKRVTNYGWSSNLDLTLTFKYSSNRYLEILNKKAFGEETLLAQAGGYIGKILNPVCHFARY